MNTRRTYVCDIGLSPLEYVTSMTDYTMFILLLSMSLLFIFIIMYKMIPPSDPVGIITYVYLSYTHVCMYVYTYHIIYTYTYIALVPVGGPL